MSVDRGQLGTMRLLPFTAAADEAAWFADPRHDRRQRQQVGPGQSARWLTDLPARLVGTGETLRDIGDAQRGLRLVSETRRNAGDEGDVRNPAT